MNESRQTEVLCIEKDKNEKLLRMLGLAARAGKLVYGSPLVCDELKKGRRQCLVLLSSFASNNTKKRITDRCGFYGVKLFCLELETEELAHRLGKSGELAVVAVTDRDFADGINKLINSVSDTVSETKER